MSAQGSAEVADDNLDWREAAEFRRRRSNIDQKATYSRNSACSSMQMMPTFQIWPTLLIECGTNF